MRVAIVVVEFVVFLAGGALTDLVVLVTVLYLEDASIVVERKSLTADGALTSLLENASVDLVSIAERIHGIESIIALLATAVHIILDAAI